MTPNLQNLHGEMTAPMSGSITSPFAKVGWQTPEQRKRQRGSGTITGGKSTPAELVLNEYGREDTERRVKGRIRTKADGSVTFKPSDGGPEIALGDTGAVNILTNFPGIVRDIADAMRSTPQATEGTKMDGQDKERKTNWLSSYEGGMTGNGQRVHVAQSPATNDSEVGPPASAGSLFKGIFQVAGNAVIVTGTPDYYVCLTWDSQGGAVSAEYRPQDEVPAQPWINEEWFVTADLPAEPHILLLPYTCPTV